MKLNVINNRADIETDEWEGTIALDSGANLIKLFHKPSKTQILRSPKDDKALQEWPECYGMPVLFPPNRIANGIFSFKDKSYSLPINSRKGYSHIHGLVLGITWQLRAISANYIVAAYTFDEKRPEYKGFPHKFALELHYHLKPDRVIQTLTINNQGSDEMPYGLGLHTAFEAPYDEKTVVQIPHTANFWAIDNKESYPTGDLKEWSASDLAWLTGKTNLNDKLVSTLFPLPKDKRTIKIIRENVTIKYVIDSKYPNLICWNEKPNSGYFCIEPMSWITNAPNIDIPYEKSGVKSMQPGETQSYSCEIRI